jgi:hypothetical protein
MTLEGALDRFVTLEHRRQMRRALAEAREQRDLIIARLAFLDEVVSSPSRSQAVPCMPSSFS